MAERAKERTWRSVHEDYIKFAVLSYRASRRATSDPNLSSYLNRNVIDTIRYSYDCLEASVEFIHQMGLLKQLPVDVPDNWLARYLHRRWDGLSLSDRIGMLTCAWLRAEFWQSHGAYQLFAELRRVRDGLTHPVPFGTELEREILRRQEFQDGSVFTESRPIGESTQIGKRKMDFGSKTGVAQFSRNPCLLGADDAERALEIMLRHLSRFERLFYGRTSTAFAFFDAETGGLRSPDDLLGAIGCRFESAWSAG